MGYIYKIINNINGKIYIGQTRFTIEERWYGHKKAYINGKKYPLYLAFDKYGINNFSISVIEKCDNNDLDLLEEYWIKYYDSYNNGYNATTGGKSGRHLSEDLILKIKTLFENGKTITEISNILSIRRGTISKYLYKYLKYTTEDIQKNSKKN